MIQQVWPVCETRTEDMSPHETLELIAPGAHIRDWIVDNGAVQRISDVGGTTERALGRPAGCPVHRSRRRFCNLVTSADNCYSPDMFTVQWMYVFLTCPRGYVFNIPAVRRVLHYTMHTLHQVKQASSEYRNREWNDEGRPAAYSDRKPCSSWSMPVGFIRHFALFL
jgi:hypothetical protein